MRCVIILYIRKVKRRIPLVKMDSRRYVIIVYAKNNRIILPHSLKTESGKYSALNK